MIQTGSSRSSEWQIRRAAPGDFDFLKLMLYEAAFWRPGLRRPPFHAALADPRLARYLQNWGRAGDTALVAVDSSGQPIGAAWYRLFAAGDPGYGFIAAGIPEVTIAVVPAHRRKGTGTALLKALLALARKEGLTALSLSVEQDNPALELYERLGFVRIKPTENSWTLQVNLTV